MNLNDVRPTIESRMRMVLQNRRVAPAPGKPIPTSSRYDDAADVCGVTVEVVMEYVCAQHADISPDERRIEAERVATFLGWCWFPKLEVEPSALLAAMRPATLQALRASAAPEAETLWSQLAGLELHRREGGPGLAQKFQRTELPREQS